MTSTKLDCFDSIEAAKEKLREMREKARTVDERKAAHALANAITQALLRLYFATSKQEGRPA